MTVYLAGFALSLFLVYYSECKDFRGKNARIAIFLAILIPCLIAGLRDKTVGTDVGVYVEPLFLAARSESSFFAFWESSFSVNDWSISYVSDFEIGFTVLCYISAKLFGNLQVLLFAIQAFTVIPIYKGLRAFSKHQPVWIGMAVYYFLFFNQTLNMMRQWIAMAFLFYAFQFLVSKKYRRYFAFLLMAMLFHFTAIWGIFIFVSYRLTVGHRASSNRWGTILLVLLGLFAILSLDVWVQLLKWLGLRYDHYISGSLQMMPRQIYYRIPIILLLLWRWKYLKEKDPSARFYIVMLVYDLLASQLTSIFVQSGRIGLYFSEYCMLAYPALCVSSVSKKNRQIMRIITLCYLLVYWLYVYEYGNSSSTVPYISCFAAS